MHYKDVKRYPTEDGLCFQTIEAYFSFRLRDNLIYKQPWQHTLRTFKIDICDCGPSAEKFAHARSTVNKSLCNQSTKKIPVDGMYYLEIPNTGNFNAADNGMDWGSD